jgi:hypothetical protein
MPDTIDMRLLDAVAMCLCWAEFGKGIERRRDDPAIYWAAMGPEHRQKYYRDATPLALAMMGDQKFAVVPVEATEHMLDEALDCDHRLTKRSIPLLRRCFANMVRAARIEMNWRQPPEIAP